MLGFKNTHDIESIFLDIILISKGISKNRSLKIQLLSDYEIILCNV